MVRVWGGSTRTHTLRVPSLSKEKGAYMAATAPGPSLNAPAELVGVVCDGLQTPSGSVLLGPPPPPAAPCPSEGLLCDAAVIFEGLRALSLPPSTPANSAAALASAVVASRRADPTVGGSLAHSMVLLPQATMSR
jgi:hypothetical protein